MNTYDSSRTFVQTQTFLVPFVPSLADHVVFVGLMSSSVDAALAKVSWWFVGVVLLVGIQPKEVGVVMAESNFWTD